MFFASIQYFKIIIFNKMTAKKVGIIVTVDYKGNDESQTRCTKDVANIEGILSDFRFDTIYILSSSNADSLDTKHHEFYETTKDGITYRTGIPTKTSIERAFLSLEENDAVFFYYSGHGMDPNFSTDLPDGSNHNPRVLQKYLLGFNGEIG